MKRILRFCCLSSIVIGVATAQPWPEAKITVRVTDENGAVMRDVDVGVTFDQPKHKPGVWGSSDVSIHNGKTDNQGLFSASDRSGNYVNCGAKALGYYKTDGIPVEFQKSQAGKWTPWNPTVELILKKIVNPTSMYARRVETQMPTADATVKFDLLEGDWVAPNGHGKASDLVFKLTKRGESFRDFGAELQITFSNVGDGIQQMAPNKNRGSELRSSHIAPAVGYAGILSLSQGNSKERGEYGTRNHPEDYVFRVRALLDEHGQIASALYGKIYGAIEYFPVSYKTAKLRFTYYLNPALNDRNVEFDPKRNLFTNLKPEEQVTAP